MEKRLKGGLRLEEGVSTSLVQTMLNQEIDPWTTACAMNSFKLEASRYL